MPEIFIVLIILFLVASVGVGFVAVRRSRTPELEPPPQQSTSTLDQGAKTEAPAVAATEGTAPPEPDTTLSESPDTVEFAEAPAPEDLVEPEVPEAVEPTPEVVAPPEPVSLRKRLARARSSLSGYLGAIVGRSSIDADTWDELEEALILADVGVSPTMAILDELRAKVKAEGITDPNVLLDTLKADLTERIAAYDRSLVTEADPDRVCVWLFVGVNGVGKTTSIGKVSAHQASLGKSVLLAAGDTFRAAAAEQLEMWAQRSNADFVRGAEGGDPSSVIFDGIARAASKGHDLVLADTAGRLHTKTNLMEELSKVRRVSDREPGQVREVLLVIDATTGQNGLTQARQFAEAADVTGVVLTKLDGSAKGGIVVAIQEELNIPVKLVGLGEGIDDLVEFDPHEFVEALFSVADA